MKNSARPLLALLATVPALPLPLTLSAATLEWTGTTSGTWATTTPANWNGVTPVFDATADVVFSDTPAISTYLTYLGDGPRTVRSLTVQGTHATPLEIRTNNNSTVGRTLHFSAGADAAQLNIAASVTQPVHIGSGTSGNNNGSVNLASDLVIDHQGSGLLTLSRPVNETGGVRSLTKRGTGTLLLSAANTYTGSTTIHAGILQLGTGTSLGTTAGDTFVQPGGTLDLNGQLLGAGETLTLSGAGHLGRGALYASTAAAAPGSANAILDDLTLSGPTTIGAASGVRYGIGGNGTTATRGLHTLTKVGAGQFDLRGHVTIGDIVVQEGSLQTEGAAVYNNSGYTVTVASGAYFRFYQIANPFTRAFTLNGGKIASGESLVTPTGNLITGAITLNGACGIESNGAEGRLITFAGNIGEGTPGSSLTLAGARRTVLSGANTYTGPTTVTNGILQASGSFTSDIVFTNPAAALDGEGTTTGTVTLLDGSRFYFDPTTTGEGQHFRAADIILPADGKVLVHAKVAGGGTGVIVLRDESGGLDLSKFELQDAGRGTLTLGGAGGNSDLIYNANPAHLEWRALNNDEWGTNDNWSNFQDTATGQPSDFYTRDHVDFVDAAAGQIILSGPVLAGNITFRNTGENEVILRTFGSSISIDATSVTTTPATTGAVTLEIPLTGPTPLTLDGPGTVYLAAANTSTAPVTVNAGTLQIGAGSFTGSLTAPVVNHSRVVTHRSDAFTHGSVISGTLTQAGSGTTTLTAENTYTGLTTVAAGVLQIGSGTTGSIAGDLHVLAGASADFSRSNAATYPGTITGDGAVAKRGTGTLTLTGTNSHTGGLSLHNGITIAGPAQLGTGRITLGPALANTNTLSLTGGEVTNDIYFSDAGTGLKIINLATGTTSATLAGTLHLDANTFTGSGVNRISPASGTITITGRMTGTGASGYSKRAAGHVVIANSANDYTGPTSIVDAGTLIVDGRVPGDVVFGEGAGGGTGNVGGTLAGSGTIGGSVRLAHNSNLSPGGTSTAGVNAHTPATLTIAGGLDASLLVNGTGRLRLQLGTTSDRIQLGGQLTLGSDLLGLGEFVIGNAGGLTAGTYTLIQATGGISGTLDPLDLTREILPGFTGTLAIVGNEVQLTITGSGSPYEAWAATFPGLTDTDFDLDFDGDGIPTGLEWILGGDPTVSDAAAIAPRLTGDPATGLTLSFSRREDSIGLVPLTVEYGSTLATWPGSALIGATSTPADVNGVTITIDEAPTPDRVTIHIPATQATQGKLFARLKAPKP